MTDDPSLTFAEQARLARVEQFERRQVEREAWLAAAERGEWPQASEPEAWQHESLARWNERERRRAGDDLWKKLTGG